MYPRAESEMWQGCLTGGVRCTTRHTSEDQVGAGSRCEDTPEQVGNVRFQALRSRCCAMKAGRWGGCFSYRGLSELMCPPPDRAM